MSRRRRNRADRQGFATVDVAGEKFRLTFDQFRKLLFDLAYYDSLNSGDPDFFDPAWSEAVGKSFEGLPEK